MAIGDSPTFLRYLKSLIPPGWFASIDAIRDAILGGLSDDLANTYSLLQAVRAATRIKTASGWVLDLICWDFFGPNLLRLTGEPDSHFQTRFLAEIFRERVTRRGISKAISDLTGLTPAIFDPTYPLDTGGYGIPMMGYGVAGAYGSLSLPNEIFITAFRPRTQGIPNVNGYGGYLGGYGVGAVSYCDQSQNIGLISDQSITAEIVSVVASGVNPVISISN